MVANQVVSGCQSYLVISEGSLCAKTRPKSRLKGKLLHLSLLAGELLIFLKKTNNGSSSLNLKYEEILVRIHSN